MSGTIYEATVREDKENNEVIFEFYGNGFLYNQVRIMVATLLEIGNGKRPVHDFCGCMKSKTAMNVGKQHRQVDFI